MHSTKHHYEDINTMLDELRLPRTKNPLFYVSKFENHDFNDNDPKTVTHDYFEINLSLGYDANISVGKQTSNVLEYSLVFISPGQMVKWEANRPTNRYVVGYLMLFKPEFLFFANGLFSLYKMFPFLSRNTLPSYKLDQSQKDQIQKYFEAMVDEYEQNEEGGLEIIRSYLTIFLFKIKRYLKQSDTTNFLSNRADVITHHFENAIIQEEHKRRPLQYYAAQLNISPIYLSESIKKSTGKTAKQIIDEYLILEAKSLLNQTDASIAEIAYELGFEDNSNFVKYFKKNTGHTPLQYRSTL